MPRRDSRRVEVSLNHLREDMSHIFNSTTHSTHRLLNNWRITPVLKYIVSVTLGGIPKYQKSESCRPYIEIYNVKENKLVLIYSDKTEVY